MQPLAVVVAWSVCPCVCLSIGHNREPCKNDGTDRYGFWGVHSWGSEQQQRIRWESKSLREGARLRETYWDVPSGRYTQSDSQGGGSGDAAVSPLLLWRLVLDFPSIKLCELEVMLHALLYTKCLTCAEQMTGSQQNLLH